MYSYEDRIKAVQLYERYGKRAAAVIRELGYPNRHILAKWYQEYVSEAEIKNDPYQRRLETTGRVCGNEGIERECSCSNRLKKLLIKASRTGAPQLCSIRYHTMTTE